MPKKKKLKLNGLKVQSFVTSLGENFKEKIKGGYIISCPWHMACYTRCTGECVYSPCWCPSYKTDCTDCDTCLCGGGGGDPPVLIQN
jgi:hypothetical protein